MKQFILSQATNPINAQLLRNIATYLTRMLTLLGVNEDEQTIGESSLRKRSHVSICSFAGFASSATGAVNREEEVQPYLNVLRDFRQTVRERAQLSKNVEVLKVRIDMSSRCQWCLLQECDRLRDELLPELGVRLEDQTGGSAIIKLADRDELMREREQRRQVEHERQVAKAAKALKQQA